MTANYKFIAAAINIPEDGDEKAVERG